ncbi:MAG: UvrD-helicase domain-containing protein [Chitinophagaceae bacterium]
MYVYISQQVEQSASQQNIINIIETIQDQIEHGDSLLFGLLFSPRFPYWIKKIRQRYRLIATIKIIDQEIILCCTHLLLRGSNKYRAFLQDREQWGNQNIHLNTTTLRNWLQHRQTVQAIEQVPLPEDLRPWLEKPILLQREDQIIYESSIWVEQWNESESFMRQNWQNFHNIILRISEEKISNIQNKNSNLINELTQYEFVQYCTDKNTNCTVLYSLVRPSDEQNRQFLFLLAAFNTNPTAQDIAKTGNSLGMFGLTVAGANLFSRKPTSDQLAQFARRAYPSYLLYDPGVWQGLEQENNTNLAFSGEEEELLHGMRFPAFINGRAGSGKSTMLHYAFAYYCDLYLKTLQEQITANSETFTTSEYQSNVKTVFRPLFLTYNDRLASVARQVVKRILVSHVHYMENWQTDLNPQLFYEVDKCFQPFQTFLLQQLPPQVSSRFAKKDYISFYRFKQIYRKAFPNAEYSAEICWHVIRTYIKGFDFSEGKEGFLTSDEYCKEIPQAYKNIEEKVFKAVEDKVWKWYKNQQQEHGYWDDQDLVREVLSHLMITGTFQQEYAAIFCDEAQDFTRVELQVILRLSVWSKYQLYPPISSLPFAFAGDPMQTLNPTGFDWTSLRSSFYDYILKPLDPRGDLGLCKPDYTLLQELQQNYRSPRNLVHFSNLVHLWRRILFDLKDLKPQIPWWTNQASIPPQKGIISQGLTITELKKVANEGAIFILPCDDGEELSFLQSSDELRSLFPCVTENKLPPNVYSSIEVKGMEFSSVVVCAFGEYFAKEFDQTLGNFSIKDNLNKHHLKLEYFLNKLYVAVSRSTNILGIIDTQRGSDLWQEAHANEITSWHQQLHPDQQSLWKSHIDGLHDTFNTKVFQKSQPLELAKTFLREGIEQRNSRFFESSAYYYNRIPQPTEAEYSKTWIVRLDGKLQEAGQQFMKMNGLTDQSLNPAKDAWDCFWEGQHWSDLLEWCDYYPEKPESLWKGIPFFMNAFNPNLPPLELVELLSNFTALIASITLSKSLVIDRLDDTWRVIFNTYRQGIEQVLVAHLPEQKCYATWQSLLVMLGEMGLDPETSFTLAARCAYRNCEYEAAIDLWEQHTSIFPLEHPEYFLSKAAILPIPENISWLSRAQNFKRIVEIWQQESPLLNEEWQAVLGELCHALEHQNRTIDLLEIEIQLGQWIRAIQRLKEGLLAAKPDFDTQLSLRTLTRMAQDKNLSPESIEQEARQVFNVGVSSSIQEEREALRTARNLLCEFVTKTTQLNEWNNSLAQIQEAGQAFDRIGEFLPALRFYLRFRDHKDLEICKFAREKWSEVKRRQIDYLQEMKRKEDAMREQQRLESTLQSWQCIVPQKSSEIQNSNETVDTTNDTFILRKDIQSSLENLSEQELQQVCHYIKFLKFERQKKYNY